MNKLRDAINRFLQDRYGMDQLGNAIFILYLATFVLNLATGNSIFYTLGLVLVVLFLFRCLSRNFEARHRENDLYLDKTAGISRSFRLLKRRWQDRHTHVYRKCPYCKTTIRLPKVKGKHVANCPKCHRDFDVKV